eukprot:scaffold587_cov339-Pavlova_lutheri.AAC.57
METKQRRSSSIMGTDMRAIEVRWRVNGAHDTYTGVLPLQRSQGSSGYGTPSAQKDQHYERAPLKDCPHKRNVVFILQKFRIVRITIGNSTTDVEQLPLEGVQRKQIDSPGAICCRGGALSATRSSSAPIQRVQGELTSCTEAGGSDGDGGYKAGAVEGRSSTRGGKRRGNGNEHDRDTWMDAGWVRCDRGKHTWTGPVPCKER